MNRRSFLFGTAALVGSAALPERTFAYCQRLVKMDEVLNHIQAATIQISCEIPNSLNYGKKSGVQYPFGTGVVYKKSNYLFVVTNEHVAYPRGNSKVSLRAGKVVLQRVVRSESADIAILRTKDGLSGKVLPSYKDLLNGGAATSSGDFVYFFGYPLGNFKFVQGLVSNPDLVYREWIHGREHRGLRITAPGDDGVSGSMLVKPHEDGWDWIGQISAVSKNAGKNPDFEAQTKTLEDKCHEPTKNLFAVSIREFEELLHLA